jgi:hypothetical protein
MQVSSCQAHADSLQSGNLLNGVKLELSVGRHMLNSQKPLSAVVISNQ